MKKILILDDNLDILQVIEAVLTYEHYEVMATETSKGFFSLVEKFRPHLILLDYRLADGDGGALCQQLKEHPQFKHIPVAMCSAYMHAGLDLQTFGCEALILKPFDLDELLSVARRLIKGKPSISEVHVDIAKPRQSPHHM